MRAPLGSRGALLGDLGISLGAALGGRQRRPRIDMRGRGRWPSAGATLDLDFVNQQGYAYGQGIGRIQDLVTISGGAGGTVVGPSGLIVSASAPRFDHDPVSLACKGLLIEEQRTNYAPYSDNGLGWLAGGTTPPTVTNGVSYLGESCVKIDFTSAMGNSYSGCRATRNDAGYAFMLNLGGVYSFAAHVSLSRQLTTGEEVVLYVTGAWGFGSISFNSATSGPYVSKFVRAGYNNTAGTVVGVGGTDYFTIYKNTLNADLSVYLTRVQVEAGTFFTSHIPTGAAAVSRTSDAATVVGANFTDLFNPREGLFVIEFATQFTGGASFTRGVVGAGVAARYAYIGSGASSVASYDGSTILAATSVTDLNVHKFASGYDHQKRVIVLDGRAALTDAVAPAYSAGTDLAIGTYVVGGAALGGYMRRLRYFPKLPSIGELQELTR